MSKEVKIILIVIGSLAALVLVVIIGGAVFFVTSISHQIGSNDAAGKARAAAKIATFTLPPGYHYAMAMDMGFTNMVMVSPLNVERKGFIIEIQGISIPSAGAQSDEQLIASMQQSLGRSAHCGSTTTVGDDDIKTASGQTVDLRELSCKGENGQNSTIEFGHIPSNYPMAILMAMGADQSFDRTALHQLVGSMR
jgi:hypothetical protein